MFVFFQSGLGLSSCPPYSIKEFREFRTIFLNLDEVVGSFKDSNEQQMIFLK